MKNKTEIEKAIDQLEAKHLEMFGLLWDLKFGGHKPQEMKKGDPLKVVSKMLAERFTKLERLANYTPKVLTREFKKSNSAFDVQSDDIFIKETQPGIDILKGLQVTQEMIHGVRFNVYTDGYRHFVKGVDYENAIKSRFSDVSLIKTQDILTVSDVAYLLGVNGIN